MTTSSDSSFALLSCNDYTYIVFTLRLAHYLPLIVFLLSDSFYPFTFWSSTLLMFCRFVYFNRGVLVQIFCLFLSFFLMTSNLWISWKLVEYVDGQVPIRGTSRQKTPLGLLYSPLPFYTFILYTNRKCFVRGLSFLHGNGPIPGILGTGWREKGDGLQFCFTLYMKYLCFWGVAVLGIMVQTFFIFFIFFWTHQEEAFLILGWSWLVRRNVSWLYRETTWKICRWLK